MTPEQFMYWLSGLLEDTRIKTLDEAQVKMIRDHMGLVMTKVTPDPFPTQPGTLDVAKLLGEARKRRAPYPETWERTTLIC